MEWPLNSNRTANLNMMNKTDAGDVTSKDASSTFNPRDENLKFKNARKGLIVGPKHRNASKLNNFL